MPAGKPKSWTDAEDERLLLMCREGCERRGIAEALGPADAVTDRKRKLLAVECPTN